MTGTPQTSNFIKIITKIIKNVTFCLLTLNECNFATTGSWAVKFLHVSDLGQNSRIFEFVVCIILLLFEFLESVVGRILVGNQAKFCSREDFCMILVEFSMVFTKKSWVLNEDPDFPCVSQPKPAVFPVKIGFYSCRCVRRSD